MNSTTSEITIRSVSELFARVGFPETLVSDSGPQFISSEFQSFVKSIGARHIRISAYHPSSTGLAERFVQCPKSALGKNSAVPLWSALADFLLFYRTTPHATTGEASSVLLLGRQLRTRLDIIKPSVETRVSHKQFTDTVNRTAPQRIFYVGDNVLVRNFRPGRKWLPAITVSQTDPISYRLKVATRHGTYTWTPHRDHLLSAHNSCDPLHLSQTVPGTFPHVLCRTNPRRIPRLHLHVQLDK